MNDQSMDLFLNACGVAGPLQLHTTRPDGQEVVHLTLVQPFALIGSTTNNDLALNHGQVSRRHAYVQTVGGHLFCVDLQSRTGVRWGSRAERAGWLGPGQSVGIGPYQVQPEIVLSPDGFDAAPVPDWSPLAQRSIEQAPLPEVALEFLNGQTRQQVWPMRSTIALVGRVAGCQIRLVESSVSRFHCSLLRTPLGLWVVDLLGREGVRVNGERVRHSRLQDCDHLQVGRFLIRVHCRPLHEVRSPYLTHSPGDVAASFLPSSDSSRSEESPDLSPQTDGRHDLVAAAGNRSMTPLPSAPALPPAEMADSFLMPLISQFNQMQQQMFDQFHQSVLMMVQMFSALHRDQMGLIREELDRLHQLTHELHSLQAELAKHPSSADRDAEPFAPPAAALPAPSLDASAVELLKQVKELLLSGHSPVPAAEVQLGNGESPHPTTVPAEEAAAPPPPAANPAAAPASPRKTPASRKAKATPARPAAPPPAPAKPPPSSRPAPAAPAPAASGAASSPPPTNGAAAPPRANEDIHAWLQQRIAAIQQERESRWQKILNFMLGK